MNERQSVSSPTLAGWAIALGAGVVATLASLLAIGIEGNGSVLIGIVVALVVGIVFTWAGWDEPLTAPVARAAPVATPAPAAAPVARAAAPAAAAPAPDAAEPAAPAPAEGDTPPGTRPEALAGPRDGKADDLKRIKGVGPVLEGKLNNLGIYHYSQIAAWTADEIAWVDGFLNFKGRIERDDWIAQAGTLAAGGETEFSARADGK